MKNAIETRSQSSRRPDTNDRTQSVCCFLFFLGSWRCAVDHWSACNVQIFPCGLWKLGKRSASSDIPPLRFKARRRLVPSSIFIHLQLGKHANAVLDGQHKVSFPVAITVPCAPQSIRTHRACPPRSAREHHIERLSRKPNNPLQASTHYLARCLLRFSNGLCCIALRLPMGTGCWSSVRGFGGVVSIKIMFSFHLQWPAFLSCCWYVLVMRHHCFSVDWPIAVCLVVHRGMLSGPSRYAW